MAVIRVGGKEERGGEGEDAADHMQGHGPRVSGRGGRQAVRQGPRLGHAPEQNFKD